MAANTSAAWESVKQHSRRLSAGTIKSITSPSKDIKFTKFEESSAPIRLNLDGVELAFENRMWHLVDSSNNGEEAPHLLSQLKEKNRTLQEENQLLKFKVELLLDMLSTTKLDLLNSEMMRFKQ